MNSSLLRAGRITHLKIVSVALVAVITIVMVGSNARVHRQASDIQTRSAVAKNAKSPDYAQQGLLVVR